MTVCVAVAGEGEVREHSGARIGLWFGCARSGVLCGVVMVNRGRSRKCTYKQAGGCMLE